MCKALEVWDTRNGLFQKIQKLTPGSQFPWAADGL